MPTTTSPAAGSTAHPSVLDVALRQRFQEMAALEQAAAEAALALMAAGNRHAVLHRLRLEHASYLKDIVARQGWPTASVVGDESSTYCLHLLLVCGDLAFQIRCKALIEQAVAAGECHAVHYAFISDRTAVAVGARQQFGTQIDPVTTRPYPIEDSENVDGRRSSVGLAPLVEVLEGHRARLRGEAPARKSAGGAGGGGLSG
ncbi:hypothetical protein OG592_43270 (plasmid) [Streptomyces avidinii]|uniref:DUF6624 domain-containing protein n=1 Tax=Streptomyces avidinii TaxID=1895 RepID=UPI002F9117E0|nr:hypothetical protein OG592_43270 [Streptomyces avidinii]